MKYISDELMRLEIRNIFLKLDDVIFNCRTNKPVPFDLSKFKKEYDKLKKEFL